MIPKFCDAIRQLREGTGITQREMAEALGVHYTYISKIENGKNIPGEELIEQICGMFSCPERFVELLSLAGIVSSDAKELATKSYHAAYIMNVMTWASDKDIIKAFRLFNISGVPE